MRFQIKISSGKEVLFVGYERGNSVYISDWKQTGRWKLNMSALEDFITKQLLGQSFGGSVECFVFGFEIADFELWGKIFRNTANYTSYRPKYKTLVSVGQIRWSNVKNLSPHEQLVVLKEAIRSSIIRIGNKSRKPRDFDYARFANVIDEILSHVSEDIFIARSTT